mmetsp:Transcript_33242/g.106047  ORF Transcript_33242/g.106047 Transcript_33242/m.106047 type:complete len:238 (-) Transcript_33242:599-1312(-)
MPPGSPQRVRLGGDGTQPCRHTPQLLQGQQQAGGRGCAHAARPRRVDVGPVRLCDGLEARLQRVGARVQHRPALGVAELLQRPAGLAGGHGGGQGGRVVGWLRRRAGRQRGRRLSGLQCRHLKLGLAVRQEECAECLALENAEHAQGLEAGEDDHRRHAPLQRRQRRVHLGLHAAPPPCRLGAKGERGGSSHYRKNVRGLAGLWWPAEDARHVGAQHEHVRLELGGHQHGEGVVVRE